MIKIPAHIFWPGFIIGLLGIAITASFTILYFAQSDGGPQVVPDYYQKSAEYDDYYQARQDSIELGWRVDLELESEPGQLRVTTRDGEPIDGIEGTLAFYRPSLAEAVSIVVIEASDVEAGLYTFESIADEPGLWDVELSLERGDDAFIHTVRKDLPRS